MKVLDGNQMLNSFDKFENIMVSMHHHFKCKCFQIVAFSCENSPQKRALMVRSSAEIVYISSPRVALGDGWCERKTFLKG
jgi:hypothetical protein